MESEEPQNEKLPGEFEEIFSNFNKLMIVKICREEKTLYGINNYIEATLGKKFISMERETMEEVFKDTDFTAPIVFILSVGADPLKDIDRFTQEQGKQNK